MQPLFPDMKGPDAPPPPRSSHKACLRLAGGSPETPVRASHHSLAPGAGAASALASQHAILTSILYWSKYIGIPVWRSMNPAGSQGLLGFQLKDRLSCPALFHLYVEATWTVCESCCQSDGGGEEFGYHSCSGISTQACLAWCQTLAWAHREPSPCPRGS